MTLTLSQIIITIIIIIVVVVVVVVELRRRQNCPEYGKIAWIWPKNLGDFAFGGAQNKRRTKKQNCGQNMEKMLEFDLKN